MKYRMLHKLHLKKVRKIVIGEQLKTDNQQTDEETAKQTMIIMFYDWKLTLDQSTLKIPWQVSGPVPACLIPWGPPEPAQGRGSQ